MADRRWSRKLIFFHKIILGLLPSYLQIYLTQYDNGRPYLTQYATQKSIQTFRGITKAFESSSFPCCAKEWGNLSKELRNIHSIKTFQFSILNFVRPRENSIFAIHDINGLKLLTRLRLNFSHLNEHKLQHNFNDIINPRCLCKKQLFTISCAVIFIPYRLELISICPLNIS